MAHPYPIDLPAAKLTPRGKATLRELVGQDETRLTEMHAAREELMAEVASIDEVIADLNETIERRRLKLTGDVISLLPSDQKVAPLLTAQGDASAHAAQWEGPLQAAPVFPPAPQDETCPCGLVMSWDTRQGAYVHTIGGGWELAGDACRHAPKDATKVLPLPEGGEQ